MSRTPPFQLRLQLAQAVAAPGAVAWRIDEHNHRVGDRPLRVRDAVELDACFYLDGVDPGILAVDFDHEDAAQCAAGLYLALRERGYLPVLLASGGEGRRHIFCRLPSPQQGDLSQFAKSLGGDHRDKIRPPLARHKLGGRGHLLVPEDPEEALHRLHTSPGPPVSSGTGQLLHGSLASGVDRSSVLYSIALGLANRSWTWEEFELLLQTPGTLAHRLFQSRATDRGPEHALEWARKYVWESAVAYVAEHPPVGGQASAPLLPNLFAYDAATPWIGRSGPATRAVFLALVRCYAVYGAEPFHASRRRLLELSGLGSTNTVGAALHALEDHQVIVRRSRVADAATSEQGATDSWRFGSAIIRASGECRAVRALPLELIGHDVFHYDQLGKTAELTYHRIVQGIVDEGPLAANTGISPRTLRTHLRRLARAGLIRQVGRGSWMPTDATLDQVAHKLEVPVYSRIARERHHRERLAYQAWSRGVDRS